MKKRTIKVVKRDQENAQPEPILSAEEILVQQQKDAADEDRDMTKAVKNWISERRENSQVEESYSNSLLLGWDPDGPVESSGETSETKRCSI
jgi:hypothetical protein